MVGCGQAAPKCQEAESLAADDLVERYAEVADMSRITAEKVVRVVSRLAGFTPPEGGKCEAKAESPDVYAQLYSLSDSVVESLRVISYNIGKL